MIFCFAPAIKSCEKTIQSLLKIRVIFLLNSILNLLLFNEKKPALNKEHFQSLIEPNVYEAN